MDTMKIETELAQNGLECGSCGEELNAHGEVFLLQVVRPYVVVSATTHEAQIQFEAQTKENGDYTDYPYFFHGDCWSEMNDELIELIGTVQPDHSPEAICRCNYCHAGVIEGDLLGIVHYGAFKLSLQQPNGHDALEHTMERGPTYICSACLCELNLNVVEGLWGEESQVMDAEGEAWVSD